MEFASKGTLHNMISEFHSRPMPENIVGFATLNAFHSRGYVHCDIKPANILVFPSNTYGEPWSLKLADFGLSKEPCTDSRSLLGGTKQYMAPECCRMNGGLVGPAVDIWALGCVVLQMFGGCPVKMGDCYIWRLRKLVSPVAYDFLRLCLKFQPSRRATAVELLNHPFIARQRFSVPRPEMILRPSVQRFPCVIRNNVMEEHSRRGQVVTMIPLL